jgi:hypothetical protein
MALADGGRHVSGWNRFQRFRDLDLVGRVDVVA